MVSCQQYFSIISESSQTHNVLAAGLPLMVKVTLTFLTRKWMSQASWAISSRLMKRMSLNRSLTATEREEMGCVESSSFCCCRCLGARGPFFSKYVLTRRGHRVDPMPCYHSHTQAKSADRRTGDRQAQVSRQSFQHPPFISSVP